MTDTLTEVVLAVTARFIEKDDEFRVLLYDADKDSLLTSYNLSAAEAMSKYGVKLETEAVEDHSSARDAVKGLLTSLGGRSIVTTTELQDALLDVLKHLPEQETEDD